MREGGDRRDVTVAQVPPTRHPWKAINRSCHQHEVVRDVTAPTIEPIFRRDGARGPCPGVRTDGSGASTATFTVELRSTAKRRTRASERASRIRLLPRLRRQHPVLSTDSEARATARCRMLDAYISARVMGHWATTACSVRRDARAESTPQIGERIGHTSAACAAACERPPHTRAKPSVAGQRTLARAARTGADEGPSPHRIESDPRTIRLLDLCVRHTYLRVFVSVPI